MTEYATKADKHWLLEREGQIFFYLSLVSSQKASYEVEGRETKEVMTWD